MNDVLSPPFTVHWNERAFWVQDAAGVAFGYCYFREHDLVGTDTPRMSRTLAERTAKFIARQAMAWARR